jgi:NADPH-dependent 2,4-dienoyl-CoA reductase/sulfur reductase-like enzyme
MLGYKGDTLASALLANDVRLVGRSFKYHRPRGVLTAGSEEPNALVEVVGPKNQTPNVRATMQEVFEGLVARSQNRLGSLRFDLLAVNDWSVALPVGGVLLQDLHVAARLLGKLYEPHHPPRGGPWQPVGQA